MFRYMRSKAMRHRPEQVKERLTTPSLLVSEIFRSVQGEGPNSGKPSIFLRLGVCNLCCAWCDTPYTWLYTGSRLAEIEKRASEVGARTPLNKVYSKRDELRKLSVFDTVGEVNKLARDGVKNLVITGGEPLLHKKPLLHLLPCFIQQGFDIEFETNGTISPDGLPHIVHLNVSPKLSNSLMQQKQRLNFRVLQECMQFPSSVLKFVVDEASDLNEVHGIVKELGTDPSRVYLMPQGTVSISFREHMVSK
ncbi:Aldolase-type TIM barrel [Gracilaria domingensis]|nr:Aldolase-type TIM barrel [Gracilaria domingensis]